MAQWDAGYVTDTAYVHDFCQFQTPAILSVAALAKGVAAPGSHGESITYCDLGCGQGFTANLIAAANPQAEILAADFNPSHIAVARNLARADATKNIVFREADFAELVDDASLPDFDIVALHGVYSWISPENRQLIVAFLLQRLKPGGLAYISYDAMPGWAAMAPQAARSGAARGLQWDAFRGNPATSICFCEQTEGRERPLLSGLPLRVGTDGTLQVASRILSGARAADAPLAGIFICRCGGRTRRSQAHVSRIGLSG
jgi:SAM-dependent methyltransferase